jgi:hypothetical protein
MSARTIHELTPERLHQIAEAEYRAFDQLPPAIQKYLNECPIIVSSVKTLECFSMTGEKQTLEMLDQHVRKTQKQYPVCA